MKKAILIPADTNVPLSVIDIPGPNDADELHTMQRLVGGYIELALNSRDITIFVDEDGKSKSKPLNWRATDLRTLNLPTVVPDTGEILRGDALVMGRVNSEGETMGVADFLLKSTGLAA